MISQDGSSLGASDAPLGNSELALYQSENERLQKENNELRRDKTILEEIISEKDKLIGNLQLQVENLQKFSPTLKSPVTTTKLISGPPPRSAQRGLRSVSNPIVSSDSKSSPLDQVSDVKNESHQSELLEEHHTTSMKHSVLTDKDDTITEDTEVEVTTQHQDQFVEMELPPERNPNHHIPPITFDDRSPIKSDASSTYSLQKFDHDDFDSHTTRSRLSTTSILATPLASPNRPSAQQAHFMGIPVSEMTWGSSPRNSASPLRGKNPSLSPMRDQLFSSVLPNLHTPNPSKAESNVDDDEFNFSPISGTNGSSTNIVKLDNPIGTHISTHPVRNSLESTERPIRHSYQSSVNELDSVIEYMDNRLNVKEGRVRPRASTINTVSPQLQLQIQSPPVQHEPVSPSKPIDSLKFPHQPTTHKLPSESNLSKQSNNLEIKDKGLYANSFNSSPAASVNTNLNLNSKVSNSLRIVSTPILIQQSTPNTISSEKFSNFDENELKGLMVRPNDLETTLVAVVSVIDGSVPTGKKRADDPSITLGCFLVENSGERREIFKFTKTYSQLLEFDNIVRPHFFELLPLPELSSFLKTTPNTVEFRRQILNNYFYKLYELKVKPKDLLLAICRFVSTDPVFKFDFNENVVKDGYMLRKSSGKLNVSWKVSFCTVFESTFELTDQISGKKQVLNVLECKLVNEEDTRDIRYGISILEPRRNVLSSSNNKILLCAESYEDKAEWLEALAKASSNLKPQYVKSSAASTMSIPASDLSPDSGTLKHNNSMNSAKASSPVTTTTTHTTTVTTTTVPTTSTSTTVVPNNVDPPATPLSQSYSFDDSNTLNSVSKPKKRAGLFGKIKLGRTNSPEKPPDLSITPSTVIEPVTNLELYQQQQQYVLPSATDSTFSFSPYSPSKSFTSSTELFGSSLETAIELSSNEYKGRIIPSICYRCIDYLEKKDAIYSEGIFRLTGKSSEINQLNELFNTNYDVDFSKLDRLPEVDSISTLLKRYLRSMKESVITPKLVSSLKQLPSTLQEKAIYYKKEVRGLLPKHNFDLLYVLLEYLIKVIKNREYNKMDINNITMLFSVNFNVDDDLLADLIIDFDFIFNEAAQPVPKEDRPHLRR